ncbi:hypothetical protein [Listeria fleischmannii]|uniref:Uncharacterized protein n=1 Tax=Listeria fleischmannii FSL S10-1203 TaxID=1265822 RepID=W7DLC2_9LIST|nr:hypothetical protein [Listeria fleischmannii]EUJ53483.1 hypothetical protein MCOL2_10805 [Listeria fleischmannii FSL S10-1203]
MKKNKIKCIIGGEKYRNTFLEEEVSNVKHRKTLISMFAALVVAGGFFGFWFFHKYELAKARSELQKKY